MGLFDQYLPGMPKELRKLINAKVVENAIDEAYPTISAEQEGTVVNISTESNQGGSANLVMSDGTMKAFTSMELDLATGLDTGSLEASTIYAVFMALNGEGEVVAVASKKYGYEAPVGFSDARYVGSVYVNNSKKVRPFSQNDDSFSYFERVSVQASVKPGTSKYKVDLSSVVPKTASKALISAYAGTGVTARFFVTSSIKRSFDYVQGDQKDIEIPISKDSQEIYVTLEGGTNDYSIQITGWEDRLLK